MKCHLRKIIIIFGLFILVGCNSSMMSKPEANTNNPTSSHLASDFDDFETQLSALDSQFIRQGKFISPKNISQIVLGESRVKTRDLLGEPQAIRGTDKQWWYYNINLPLDDLDGYLVCQYRVTFTKEQGISDIKWRRHQCQNRYTALLSKTLPEIITKEVTLSSEVLFSYDSAELTFLGKQELDRVISNYFDNLQRVHVTILGHTDRLGSEVYNLALSQQRADTVDTYLRSKEMGFSNIVTDGRGSREPLVSCEGTIATEKLKDCLAPNRRVQIIINGLQEENVNKI